jgi:hypothetical protein
MAIVLMDSGIIGLVTVDGKISIFDAMVRSIPCSRANKYRKALDPSYGVGSIPRYTISTQPKTRSLNQKNDP